MSVSVCSVEVYEPYDNVGFGRYWEWGEVVTYCVCAVGSNSSTCYALDCDTL